jgi:hypothetical protein
VQCPEYDDETWDEVYAVAAEYAAKSWAEEHDRNCSHYMMGGDTIVVVVKLEPEKAWEQHCMRDEEIEVKTFTCSGEAVPTYTAEEIDGKKDDTTN